MCLKEKHDIKCKYTEKHQLGYIRVPDGIWTHDPPGSSRMLYHWATGDSKASKIMNWPTNWPLLTTESPVAKWSKVLTELC